MSFIVLVVVQVSMCNGKMLAPAWTITDRSDSWVLHDEWTSSRISCFVPVVYGFVVPTAFGNWRSGKNKQKNKTKQRTEKKRRFQSRQKKEEIIENNIPPPFVLNFIYLVIGIPYTWTKQASSSRFVYAHRGGHAVSWTHSIRERTRALPASCAHEESPCRAQCARQNTHSTVRAKMWWPIL